MQLLKRFSLKIEFQLIWNGIPSISHSKKINFYNWIEILQQSKDTMKNINGMLNSGSQIIHFLLYSYSLLSIIMIYVSIRFSAFIIAIW